MDERRIAHIVEQVVARLATDGSLGAPAVLKHPRGSGGVEGGGLGVHPTVDAAVEAARRAVGDAIVLLTIELRFRSKSRLLRGVINLAFLSIKLRLVPLSNTTGTI